MSTFQVYADEDAFAVHGASDVHAAAAPVFAELIAASDVTIGETLMAEGLGACCIWARVLAPGMAC